jgi:hypothetical protein
MYSIKVNLISKKKKKYYQRAFANISEVTDTFDHSLMRKYFFFVALSYFRLNTIMYLQKCSTLK